MKKTNKLFANLLLGANLLFLAGSNSQVLANPVTKIVSFDTYITTLDNGDKIKYKTNGRNNLHILDCTNKKVTKEMMQAIINYFNIGMNFLAVETLEFEENIILDKKVYEIREVGKYISNTSTETSTVSSDESYEEKYYEETKPKKVKKQGIGKSYGERTSSFERWTTDDIKRLRKEYNNKHLDNTPGCGAVAISKILFKNGIFPGRTVVAIRRAIERYIIGYDCLNK